MQLTDIWLYLQTISTANIAQKSFFTKQILQNYLGNKNRAIFFNLSRNLYEWQEKVFFKFLYPNFV